MEKPVCSDHKLLEWGDVEELQMRFFMNLKRGAENPKGNLKKGAENSQGDLKGSDDLNYLLTHSNNQKQLFQTLPWPQE